MKQLLFILSLFILQSSIAQDNRPKWGTDSLKTIQYISLYTTSKKQENYEDAYIYWQYVFNDAPCASKDFYKENVGGTILKNIIDTLKDASRKERLIDTLLLMHDQRIKCFGEIGNVLGRKGLDMVKYRPNNYKEILGNFSKAIEVSGDSLASYVPSPYFSVAANAYKKNIVTKEELLLIYQNLSQSIDKAIMRGKDAEKLKEAQGSIAQQLADLKLFKDCNEAKAIYEKRYKENPDNIELWKKIIDLLKSTGCVKDPLYIEVLEKFHQKEPTATTAFFLGNAKAVQGKFTDAFNYFNQSVEMETDSSKKADYYLYMANVYYNINDFASARSKALKAATFRSKWGEPYLLIADLYGGSGKLCGPGTGFESQVVTWVAVDMYQKAKSIDQNCAERANAQIAFYSKFFPSKEDIFFRELKEGDTFKVECWINETTTVRARKE